MFKDYNKFLSTSLKVYLFVLIIVFILKIVGLDYFGINVGSLFQSIDSFCYKYHLENIFYCITLYINIFTLSAIVLKDNSMKLKKYSILILIVGVIIKIVEMKYYNVTICTIIEVIYVFIFLKIYDKNVSFKRYIIVTLLFIVYQMIAMYIRNLKFEENASFVYNLILDVDYIMLELISYKLCFEGGKYRSCVTEAYSSSLKKINLKKSLKKLQKNFQNSRDSFKKKSKEEKLTIIIFTTLSLIWNTLSVIIVLIVAKINDTLIECIFILTSFWLSKRSFGKAFHFDSMLICFVVSNLTYYTLNRVTTPLGISILIPILLGVGLSYVTSKFVKKTYKPLYRGMSKELFEETIIQVVDKDSDKYNICYEFYVEKKSDVSLSYKYNYSVSGIRKIKDRVNEKIKRL